MLEAILLFLVILVTFLWWRSRPSNAPPSPGIALPVLGHLYLFRRDPFDQLSAWRKALGNIFTVQMGPIRFVILNGYDLVSEACLKHHESLLERPKKNFMHNVLFKNAGIASLGGNKWKEQRAFLQSTLRSLGMGRNVMAEKIRVEADYLVAGIGKTKGEATDISDMVMVCVSNVISGVTFSKRFDQEDEKIIQWVRFVKLLCKLLFSSAALNFFPVLKYFPGDPLRYKELQSTIAQMRATIMKWIEKDKRIVNISDQSFGDVVQAFLTEMERKKLQGVTETSLDDVNLVSTALTFFNAGTESTSNTVVFAVLYLVCFPEVQAKLFKEIKDSVGMERAPEMSDKKNLKFLSAYIMETQRFSSIVPLGVDRLAVKDIHLGGYTITKGTSVMFNLDSVLKDKNVWGDPDVFRPERFLDENNSVVIKKEFLPFGIGKRNCVGEGLAAMELFMFISSLIQKYEFFPEIEGQIPSLEPNVGLTSVAKPFKVRAIPRMA